MSRDSIRPETHSVAEMVNSTATTPVAIFRSESSALPIGSLIASSSAAISGVTPRTCRATSAHTMRLTVRSEDLSQCALGTSRRSA